MPARGVHGLSGDRLHLLDIVEQSVEQRARQIALAGIRQYTTMVLPACAGSRARRSAATMAAPHEMPHRIPSSRARRARHGDRFVVADLFDPVDQRADRDSSG